MRIALVHSYYSSRVPSGENLVVDAQSRLLREAGHEVTIVSQSTDERLQRRTYKAEAALTAATGRGPTPLRALRDFAPEVVHVHNLFPNFGTAWVDRWDGPLVHSLHNFRPICPASTFFRDGNACTDCADARSSAPARRHGCFHQGRVATVAVSLGTRFDRDPVLRRADVLTTLSQGMSDLYAATGVPREKLVVLENFVDAPPAVGRGSVPGRGPWLFAGRMVPAKGVHRLLESWPRGEPLVLAGDVEGGPLPAHPDVTVLGRVSREEVGRLVGEARGLVFPSIWPEGLALVCLEALFAGTPILTFDDIPAGRSVTDLGVGLAGRRDDVPGAVAAAAGLFPTLREHCRQVAEQRYTAAAFLERLEAVYRQAIAST